MANGVNRVIIVGNLGRDCELRQAGGTTVASLHVAATETWNDKNGARQERTEWVRVSIWGRTADALAEYLVKGKQIYLEGKLQTRKWQDKDGNDRFTTEVRADRVILLGGNQNGGSHRRAPDDDARGDGHDDRQPDDDEF